MDEGIGVPVDALDRVFERFYRAEGVPESTVLGIGLYLSKRIVEQHGGSIWAENWLGGGSRFVVPLPAQTPARLPEPSDAVV